LIVDASGSQEHFAKKHQSDLEVFLREVLAAKDLYFWSDLEITFGW